MTDLTKKLIACALALAAVFAAGCDIAPDGDITAVVEPAPTASPTPQDTSGRVAQPLEIARDTSAFGEGYIVYPRVFGQTGEKINAEIVRAVSERAEDYDGAIFTRYRIEYNDGGIFSVLINVYDFYSDELLFRVPLTFDSVTGERSVLSDYLGDEADVWRTVLPDMVTELADNMDITLLNDIPPVSDTQDFYITRRSLVLVYRLYEIATYSAGSPEFRLSLSELKPYIREDGELWRLVN